MDKNQNTARLVLHCPDAAGLVHKITGFLFEKGANLVHLDQHVDSENGHFYLRIEWEWETYPYKADDFVDFFGRASEYLRVDPQDIHYALHNSGESPRIAILCSKEGHCLHDQLLRYQSAELPGRPVVVVSNHNHLRPFVDYAGLPFEHVNVAALGKPAAEEKIQSILKNNRVDLIILARYMQILSADFVSNYPNRIINIHHSFLPAFPGARPYHQAYERGVKIIGATSHYVTAALDAGPIIAQDVITVNHRDTIGDLVRKGREVERNVLAEAVRLHLENRVLVKNNKTIVF